MPYSVYSLKKFNGSWLNPARNEAHAVISYDYYFFINRKVELIVELKRADERKLQWNTILLWECKKKKKTFFAHWVCLAFWSPFSPLYCWHEWCMLVSWPDVITPQHLQLGALFSLSTSQLGCGTSLPNQEMLCCQMEQCGPDLEKDGRQPPQRLLYSAFKHTNIKDWRLEHLWPRDKGTKNRARSKVANYHIYIFILFYFQPHYNCCHLWTTFFKMAFEGAPLSLF